MGRSGDSQSDSPIAGSPSSIGTVCRAPLLIASVPGDAASVAAAVRRHPTRFVGFFMVDPTQPDAPIDGRDGSRSRRPARDLPVSRDAPLLASGRPRRRALRGGGGADPGTAVFVHCGVLSVGVRKKLGLPSPFDIRFGNPLDLHAVALAYPQLPIIIPHFGAGILPRGADGRGPLPEHAVRHVELEQLDQVRSGPDARRRLRTGAGRRRARSPALRQRLVVLSARMGARTSTNSSRRRSTRLAPTPTCAKRSSAGTSSGSFPIRCRPLSPAVRVPTSVRDGLEVLAQQSRGRSRR